MVFAAEDGGGRLVGLVFAAGKKEALSCEEFAVLGDKVVSALGLLPKARGLLQIGNEEGFAEQGLKDGSSRRIGGNQAGKRQCVGGQGGVGIGIGWRGGFGGEELQGKEAGLAFSGGAQLADQLFGVGFGLRNQGLEAVAERGFNGSKVFIGSVKEVRQRAEEMGGLGKGVCRGLVKAFPLGVQLSQQGQTGALFGLLLEQIVQLGGLLGGLGLQGFPAGLTLLKIGATLLGLLGLGSLFGCQSF